MGGQKRLQSGDGGLHPLGVAKGRRGGGGPLGHLIQRIQKGVEGPLFSAHRSNDWHTKALGEKGEVDVDALAAGLVHQVDADHHPGVQFQSLKDQIQIPFQTGGVTDHRHGIGAAEAEEVPGHLLLGGVGQKRVSTGEVHQNIALPLSLAVALGVGHRFARPVACMLVKAGEGVEEGGFSHIGVARQGDDPVGGGAAHDGKAAVHRPQTGGGMCQSHGGSPASKEHVTAVRSADGDDGSPDEIGGGVPGGAAPQALHLRARGQADVQHPPPHGSGGAQCPDGPPLPGGQVA